LSKIAVLGGNSIMCKLESNGAIEYTSSYFTELCGYRNFELLGKKLDLIYSLDTPRVIIDSFWNRISLKQKTTAIVKFNSKSGDYFWLRIKLDYKIDENSRAISNIYLYGFPVHETVVKKIEEVYSHINDLEKKSDKKQIEKIFNDFLLEKKVTFEDFFDKILKL
jgi:PAS domain S-box-containing protein